MEMRDETEEDPSEVEAGKYDPVSYTHLDVYKRQALATASARGAHTR